MNVVIVGWAGGADLAFYPQSASNTRTMGAYTALVVNNLISNGGGFQTHGCGARATVLDRMSAGIVE